MTNERLEILTNNAGALLSRVDMPPSGREGLGQIDHELPFLLRRHPLLHNAVLFIFAGVSVSVLSVIAIEVAVTSASDTVGTAAPALVLLGTCGLLRADVRGSEGSAAKVPVIAVFVWVTAFVAGPSAQVLAPNYPKQRL